MVHVYFWLLEKEERAQLHTPYKPLPLVGNLGRVVTNDLNIGYLWKKMCDDNLHERFFGEWKLFKLFERYT